MRDTPGKLRKYQQKDAPRARVPTSALAVQNGLRSTASVTKLHHAVA